VISDRTKGIERLALVCECILVTVAFWAWFGVVWGLRFDPRAAWHHLVYNQFMVLGMILGAWNTPESVGLRTPDFEETSQRTFRQLGFAVFFLLFYLVAAQDAGISRLTLLTFIPVLYLVLLASNRFLPTQLGKLIFQRQSEHKVILVGPTEKAVEVSEWLKHNQYLGLQVLGLLTDDDALPGAGGLPRLGTSSDLEAQLASSGAMQVIVVEFPRGNGSMKLYTDLCEARGARLLVVADLDKIFGHPLSVFKDQGKFFLGLREEPLEDPLNRFFKRCLDIAVSLPVVIGILPPLMLFTWLVQRFQSPGPLMFVQPREGRYNRHFPLYKLRSMHVGDVRNTALPSSKNDPRLYPLGSFLRVSSLDEMPQFWNVLLGDMSVVGPRPHLPSYNEQYRRVCHRAYVRALVKPGLTGLAQVRGFRGATNSDREILGRIESDIEYLENWSLRLDCWLIMRTALQVLFPPKTAL